MGVTRHEALVKRPMRMALQAAAVTGLLVGSVVGIEAAGSASSSSAARTTHQYGVNAQFYDYGLSGTLLSLYAHNDFAYVKSLGGNAVIITIPFEMPSLTANNITPQSWTPTSARVGIVIADARALGLHVTLRPLVDQSNLPSWRGAIEPSNPTLWFANYLTFLEPYLKVAQTDKVTTFDIASELQGTFKLPEWPALISKAKTWFKGTIELSGSWGNGATIHMKGATSGIDAYLGVKAPPSATVATLLAGWNANLKKHRFPNAQNATTLTEVGIAAQDGAYTNPNRPQIGSNTPIDPVIQTNWFTAACEFARQHSLVGIYFWRLDIGSSLNQLPTPSDPTLFATSTVSEIKACFAGR
jgi:hypothetical protein